MRGIGLAAVLIAALSSCDPDAARAVEACSVICDCEASTFDQDECLSECVNEILQDVRIPDACFTCISDHRDRCLSIDSDCQDPCSTDEPPVPDEPPVAVDAGVPNDDAF